VRIAIIIPRLAQSGPVKVIQALVNSPGINDKAIIKVYYLDKKADPQVNINVAVLRFDRKKFKFDDFDIIHTNGIRPDLLAFINRKKIKHHISTIHNFVFEDLKYTYNSLIASVFGNIWLFLWRRADKLVCVSGSMQNYYSKWFPISKLEVIYNGILETNSFCNPEESFINSVNRLKETGLKVIGGAGNLTRRKGVDQILYLLSRTNDYAMVFLGEGKELNRLKRLSVKLNISSRCLFYGFVNHAVNYFRYFDFFMVPSRSEGFCLALVEAVQQKVPVICSDIDVFKELFNSEEVTFFKVDDKASLDRALKLSEESGKSKIESAFNRYLHNYTGKIMTGNYFDIYNRISCQ
jgi:glycosyltransferase involved in cell wall biosynthesis